MAAEFLRKFSQVFLNFCQINGIIEDDFGFEEDEEEEEEAAGDENERSEDQEESVSQADEEKPKPCSESRKKVKAEPHSSILEAKIQLVNALKEATSIQNMHLFLNYSSAARTEPKFDELKRQLQLAQSQIYEVFTAAFLNQQSNCNNFHRLQIL